MKSLSMMNVNTDCYSCVSNIIFNTQELSFRISE